MKKSPAERLWGTAYVLSFLLFAGLLHFEFMQDIHPREAIDYFRINPSVPASENIAFALNGLEAPRRIKNFHGWGIERWQYIRGLSYDEFTEKQASYAGDDQSSENTAQPPFSNLLEVETPADNSNHYCWQPGSMSDNSECISRRQLDSMLEANALVLQRYQQALGYQRADFVFGAGLVNRYVLEISNQYRIRFWLQRENLSTEDLARIAQFLYRWKHIVEQGYFNSIDYSIAMASYGYALGLFHEVAKLYPELLDLYQTNHGEFIVTPIEASLFDRLTTGDFYIIDNELCLSKSFGYNNSYCSPESRSLTYKPGRTISLLHGNRLLPSHCENPDDPRLEWRSTSDPIQKLKALFRPGNYRGRLYAIGRYYDAESVCLWVDNNRFRNETFGLYRLYLYFQTRNYSAAQITAELKAKPETFRIPHSDRYYLWDSASQSLVLKHPNPEARVMFEFPYASQQ